MLQRKESILRIKVDNYTDRIVKLYQYLREEKKEQILSAQIMRSGTSIGANIAESRNAESSKDFVHKLKIALKEADETKYWLEKLYAGSYIEKRGFLSMLKDNEEIIKILVASINTLKHKNGLD
ncbi:MAG: four helix bundle protein [Prevotella sp.]|nr:four helix bundle protein [Prevotella sp.]